MASKPVAETTETTIETVETVATETAVEVSTPDVISFGGKWLASIGGEVVTFGTKSEARTALALAKNQEAFEAEADEYCVARGYEGKNKVGKKNMIVDFLAWKATK